MQDQFHFHGGDYFDSYKKEQKHIPHVMDKRFYNLFICFCGMLFGVVLILLTGDHENAAKYVADKLHIDTLLSNCLPENKLEHIESYQKNGKKASMIGDGINDAPR